MRAQLAAIVGFFAFGFIVTAYGAGGPPAQPVGPLPAEDDQAWSCRIQGDMSCGLDNPFQPPAHTALWPNDFRLEEPSIGWEAYCRLQVVSVADCLHAVGIGP